MELSTISCVIKRQNKTDETRVFVANMKPFITVFYDKDDLSKLVVKSNNLIPKECGETLQHYVSHDSS